MIYLLLIATCLFFFIGGLFRAMVMGIALITASLLGVIPWLGPHLAAGIMNMAREILMEPAEPFKAEDFHS